MTTLTHLLNAVLLILAAVSVYGVFVLASPATGCRTCRGWGTRGRRWRRRATCHRCGGTGVRFRPGARLAHRAAASLMRHRATGTGLPLPPWRPPRDRPGPDPATPPRERRTSL